MTKQQNERCIIALAESYEQYNNANPDVGMAPGFSSFVVDAMNELNLTLNDISIKFCKLHGLNLYNNQIQSKVK